MEDEGITPLSAALNVAMMSIRGTVGGLFSIIDNELKGEIETKQTNRMFLTVVAAYLAGIVRLNELVLDDPPKLVRMVSILIEMDLKGIVEGNKIAEHLLRYMRERAEDGDEDGDGPI